MKTIVLIIMILAGTMQNIRAQVPQIDEELLRYYTEEGRREAEDMVRKFQETKKPRYQNAYDDYLQDLRVIADTGKAPDNENLYDDLRMMNNDDIFVFSDSEEVYQ